MWLSLAVHSIELPDAQVLAPHTATRGNIAARVLGQGSIVRAGLEPWGLSMQHREDQQIIPEMTAAILNGAIPGLRMAQAASDPPPPLWPPPLAPPPSPPPPPPPPPPRPPMRAGVVSGLGAQLGRLAHCRVCIDTNADDNCTGHESMTTPTTGQYEIVAPALSADTLLPIGFPVLEPSTECHDHITGFPVLAPMRCGSTVCTPLTDIALAMRSTYAQVEVTNGGYPAPGTPPILE